MIKKEQIIKSCKEETAVFVALIPQGVDDREVNDYLDELEFLAETAGVKGGKRFTQKLEKPNSRTYVGRGKLEEIHHMKRAGRLSHF